MILNSLVIKEYETWLTKFLSHDDIRSLEQETPDLFESLLMDYMQSQLKRGI
jgi:hypothetical protein